MMLSSWATSSIEEVAEAGPEAIRWLQLYIYKDREVTKQLVRRAERMGYKAIFVTVPRHKCSCPPNVLSPSRAALCPAR